METPTLEKFKTVTSHVLTDPNLDLTKKQQDKALEMLYNWFVENRKPITKRTFAKILQTARESD